MKGKSEISKKTFGFLTKALKTKILVAVLGFGAGILLFLVIILAIVSLFKPIIDVFSSDDYNKKNHMSEKLEKNEENFKKRVNEVYEDIKRERNISIDRAVLTATVTYTGDFEAMYDDYDYENSEQAIFEDESFKETEPSSLKSWLNEHVFHNTPEYQKLRRLRTSKAYLRSLGYAQIENGKVDLEAYESYLADVVIEHLYPELVKGKSASTKKRIAKEIMELAEMYYAYFGEEKSENCGSGTSCSYNVNGQSISNLKVRLLQCADMKRGEPIDGEELVDFEKYVLGVTYGEIGSSFHSETNKVQAIAARTFALSRGKAMGGAYNIGIKEENGQWILQIRNCVEDQVYCDPDQGCSQDNPLNAYQGNTMFSGLGHRVFYKDPLPEDAQLRKDVAETNGKVLLDKNGELVVTSYVNNAQNSWNSKANAGLDYTEILLSHYTNATAISEANCNMNKGDSSCSTNVTGPFANWKQCDPAWGSIGLGGSTICSIGCLATSVAIQAAASGAASSIENFNPGTFVQMGKQAGVFDGGGNMYQSNVSKVIPGFSQQGTQSLCGMSEESKAKAVQEKLNQGYYVVLEVKGSGCGGNGQHWVAVSGTSGDEINMMDPASDSTSVFATYGNRASTISLYKKS